MERVMTQKYHERASSARPVRVAANAGLDPHPSAGVVLGSVQTIITIGLALALATPPPSEPSEQEARLAFIETSLSESECALEWWYYGWIGGYAALTVGQMAPAVLADELENDADDARALRASMLTGATTAAIGAVVVGLSRPAGLGGPAVLEQMPEETSEQRARKLAVAESLLRETAELEERGIGWLAHLGNVGLNLAAGLVLWLGFDQLQDGLITFGSGWAIGAITIFTQPTRAIDDWAEYQHHFGDAPAPEESAFDWQIGVFPGGAGLIVTM